MENCIVQTYSDEQDRNTSRAPIAVCKSSIVLRKKTLPEQAEDPGRAHKRGMTMQGTAELATAGRVQTVLLVRVGVDHSAGGWNAPVGADGSFVYVPIPEPVGTPARANLGHAYRELSAVLDRFCVDRQLDLTEDLKFPAPLWDRPMHLDPDFSQLTYGDVGNRRGARMASMSAGDVLVFYAGLRPVYPCEQTLIYALIGMYVVDDVVCASSVPSARWAE